MARISFYLPAASPALRASTPRRKHVHSGDHLSRGGRLRCGCGPENIDADFTSVASPSGDVTAWTPRQRQHTGYVRARFIYSDRMLSTVR